MAASWLQIVVELEEGLGEPLDPTPGRVFLVGPATRFGRLADEINTSFGRWDRSHLHEFTLADGQVIGVADEESPETIDQDAATVSGYLAPGDAFEFLFDFGAGWRHRCRVDEDKVDPVELFGETPAGPIALAGWGRLPDQYGRETPDDEA